MTRHWSGAPPAIKGLRRFPVIPKRRAEGLEQRAIDRVVLRIVFGVPLDAEREARSVGDADRLDRAVLCHALDDDPLAGLEDALAVQRIHADRLASEEPREDSPRRQAHFVAV